jgi:hypothetical protein
LGKHRNGQPARRSALLRRPKTCARRCINNVEIIGLPGAWWDNMKALSAACTGPLQYMQGFRFVKAWQVRFVTPGIVPTDQ